MSETVLTTPPPASQAVGVLVEDDATPFARLLARTLREAIRTGHGLDALARSAGTVELRSHDTPQTATVVLASGVADVASGGREDADARLVVDLHARLAAAQEPVGDLGLATDLLHVLSVPVPHWRRAAAEFWEATRAITGMPEVLVVEAVGPDGTEQCCLGEGTSSYLVAGPPDLLAGVLAGADDLLVALGSGLRVQGTLSQLSVMTAASWKVRFDV